MRRVSIGTSVNVSKALSGFSAPATGARFRHQHQILDADAVGVGAVIAGLVGQDHAALERRAAELGDARRPFVHREVAADAVAGAVIEIEPGAPEILPRQRIELRAGRAVRKHRARDGDMALEHQREIPPHLGGRHAHRDRARDVGGAVLVLAAGIEQIKLVRRNAAIGFARHAVMHDGAVGAGAGNGRERNVLEHSGLAAKALHRFDRGDLGQFAARRLAVEPGEEARHRRAVAQLRRPRAVDLDRGSSPPSSARSDRSRARSRRRSRRRAAQSLPGRWPDRAKRRDARGRARQGRARTRRWGGRRRSLPGASGLHCRSCASRRTASAGLPSAQWRKRAPPAYAARRCRGC